jgi:hypothetical protein
MSKPELEFFTAVSGETSWRPSAGDRSGGLSEVVLSADQDSGARTTLMRFDPGVDTSVNGPAVHTTWEEVWILQGELHDLTLDQTFTAGMYACRPPGMLHGPWRSPHGAVTFQVHYAGSRTP